ncbi:MAG: hypothetical protein ACRDGM_01265, partial [bacterium]
ALETPGVAAAPALVETNHPIEARIARLLGDPSLSETGLQLQRKPFRTGLHAVAGLLSLTGVSGVVMFTSMGCGLGSVLIRL